MNHWLEYIDTKHGSSFRPGDSSVQMDNSLYKNIV